MKQGHKQMPGQACVPDHRSQRFAEDSAPLQQGEDGFQEGNCNLVFPLLPSIQHGCTEPSRCRIEDRI